MDDTYNGWTNRQTWNVMLWMDNDEQAYRAYREYVARCKRPPRVTFTGVRAKYICQQCFGDATPDGVKFSDKRIRWGEIAKAMRSE